MGQKKSPIQTINMPPVIDDEVIVAEGEAVEAEATAEVVEEKKEEEAKELRVLTSIKTKSKTWCSSSLSTTMHHRAVQKKKNPFYSQHTPHRPLLLNTYLQLKTDDKHAMFLDKNKKKFMLRKKKKKKKKKK